MSNVVFKNAIGNRKAKEYIGDVAISILTEKRLISIPRDLDHLVIEFGYLFLKEGGGTPITMIKVLTPKRLFKKQKVFYMGSQDDDFLLFDDSFDENTFRKIQKDMFVKHNVDISTINWNEYKMELY